MQFILQAFGVGFMLSVMIGPVFFVLLETSITKGVKSALAFDFGVLMSDVVYILFAYLFYSEVKSLATDSNKMIFGMVGGSILIVYGIYQFFKKPEIKKNITLNIHPTQAKDYLVLSLKGFLLNFANPLVVFYWFSVMTLAAHAIKMDPNMDDYYLLIYLAVVLLTFFGIDLLKIAAAHKLRPLVTPQLLVSLNRLIGIVFSIFGLFLVLQNFIR
jgi:threonine/homoserine/homoserine lactone efflux protein